MCGVLTLESTVLEYDGPGYVKKNCLYYKEGLQNISKAAILQNRLSLLVRKTESANATIGAVFRPMSHYVDLKHQHQRMLQEKQNMFIQHWNNLMKL
ncbi:unnamed protein product [Rhizophagus irregularis]|uniref:Uncharacterized protein n=1 Tax=Rhizophagus irregularis TaxID=588596 RepID=A0A915Z7L7_9GLOM|nr:unnamed protein product [Rhizophagus irregularis]